MAGIAGVPVEDFVKDTERQTIVYQSFQRHERVAKATAFPPVISFREDPRDINNSFLASPSLSEFANLPLAPRSGRRHDVYIARFDLDDPDNIYLVTPPIGVEHAPANTNEIGIARVARSGGYRHVWSEQKGWKVDHSSGLYVRQTTRNVPEIRDRIRSRSPKSRKPRSIA